MLMRREFYMAAGRRVRGMDVVPVVELSVVALQATALDSCIAAARPIGFAVLLPDKGYWLVGPADLSELAHAVYSCTSEAEAS